ncbi:MAG TPA: HAMP domain-containing histidine kinase [Firmicutes bacterium]|nr:HAMP domain-containing histidine kinase [Bacillota bacterium]
MRTTIKAKLIKMNLLVIAPMLLLVLLITIFTIDRYQLNNVKNNLLKDSYILQIYLNQYFSTNRQKILPEKELYFLNHDLNRMVKLRTELFYLQDQLYFDSNHEEVKDGQSNFLNDPGIRLALEHKKNYYIKKEGQSRTFLISFPFYRDKELTGVMRLTYPLQEEDLLKKRLFIVLFSVGLIVLFLLGLFLSYFTGQIVIPLAKLKFAVQSFAEGHVTDNLEITSGDEVEELAASFKEMTKKLRTLIENLRVEKNKQKNFFNQMTHEFRTPLTTIIGYADLLKKLDSDQEREECAKYIVSESRRLLRMVDDILTSSMQTTYTLNLDTKTTDLDALLRETLQIMKYKASKYGIGLNLFSKERVFLAIDRDKIKQVILNVIDNAINHSKTESVDIHLYQGKNKVAVAIRDYGQGIPPGRLEKIEKRIAGMDPELIGTQSAHGFGLPLSAKIMELHGGRLLIRTAEHVGTTVFLLFNLG